MEVEDAKALLHAKSWVMYGIKKFVGFPEMNFRRTLVVSFQLLTLVLGGRGCGARNGI